MAVTRSFPTSDIFRRRLGSLADPIVILGVLATIYILARLASGVTAPFSELNPRRSRSMRATGPSTRRARFSECSFSPTG